jgi:hypothetical protein
MRGCREERIEAVVDHGAAAILAAAACYASFNLAAQLIVQPERAMASAAVAVLVYLISSSLLRRVQAEPPKLEISVFNVRALELDRPDELLLTEQVELILTDADRLHPNSANPAGELVLDDVLAEIGPGSRVVRLFDPAAMPTPGQLDVRIQQHLRESSTAAPPADASQALFDALAELRRSLR